MRLIKIGTRKSKLALRQTELVIAALKKKFPELDCEIIPIQTKGDQVHHKPLRDLYEDGKSAFTSELETALEEQKIDVAVHSMKDVAGNVRLADLTFPAFLRRVSPIDVLITKQPYNNLSELPEDFVIGTVSLRRRAGLLRANASVIVKNLRGNVQTRIAKLKGEHVWKGHSAIEYDGIIMAKAAIERSDNDLNFNGLYQYEIPSEQIIPPAGQGVIGVQARRDDEDIIDLISQINHPNTELEVRCERDFLYELCGNCHTVIGVHCEFDDNKRELSLRAEISEEDGSNLFSISNSISDNFSTFGRDMSKNLKQKIVTEKGIEFLLDNLKIRL